MRAYSWLTPKLVRIGCSGWNYAHWRNGVFYPPRCPARLWLEYYARHFDTVEVNATFYRLPTREGRAGLGRADAAGFVFAVKASRYLTHIKRLTELGRRACERFYERIEPLVRSPKLGPILWQLPPTFRRDDERLAAGSPAEGGRAPTSSVRRTPQALHALPSGATEAARVTREHVRVRVRLHDRAPAGLGVTALRSTR